MQQFLLDIAAVLGWGESGVEAAGGLKHRQVVRVSNCLTAYCDGTKDMYGEFESERIGEKIWIWDWIWTWEMR